MMVQNGDDQVHGETLESENGSRHENAYDQHRLLARRVNVGIVREQDLGVGAGPAPARSRCWLPAAVNGMVAANLLRSAAVKSQEDRAVAETTAIHQRKGADNAVVAMVCLIHSRRCKSNTSARTTFQSKFIGLTRHCHRYWYRSATPAAVRTDLKDAVTPSCAAMDAALRS